METQVVKESGKLVFDGSVLRFVLTRKLLYFFSWFNSLIEIILF